MAERKTATSLTALACSLGLLATPVLAHHGLGNFERGQYYIFDGTITGIDFVNPHSYLYFDMTADNGETIAMRCEMRAATLMRRSGWSVDMFAAGRHVTIRGLKHREDPGSCYVEDITIGDSLSLNRNDQLETPGVDTANRPLRLPNGDPNITGDWAQEQYVIAVPPSGQSIGLVPKSMKPGIESGEIDPSEVPDSGWGPKPVTFTARGQAEADEFNGRSVPDNPRLHCRPTSIIFDMVFDGPVNRFTQEDDRIVINYGLYSFERVIHMDMDAHPDNLAPSYAGHSIGHWEDDVLVVDTVGFEPGLIAAPVKHSDQLHVVERYTLLQDPLRLHREYVATDPVYFTDEYRGEDTQLLSDVPYQKLGCDELTYEFGGKK